MRLPAPSTSPARAEVGSHSAAARDGHFLGSWAAVRWEYRRADGSGCVDLIADRSGTVTLSLSDADYVLSCALGSEAPRSAAGAIRFVAEDGIDFTPRGGPPERVGFRRASGTLVLHSETSAWDFSGAGEESALFTAVLVRL